MEFDGLIGPPGRPGAASVQLATSSIRHVPVLRCQTSTVVDTTLCVLRTHGHVMTHKQYNVNMCFFNHPLLRFSYDFS